MVFRICTEYKNPELIKRILDSQFDCYTCISSVGVWKRKQEKAVTIEIAVLPVPGVPYSDVVDTFRSAVYETAETIKATNNQEAVLVEEINATLTLV